MNKKLQLNKTNNTAKLLIELSLVEWFRRNSSALIKKVG
jgi:hypothetical protein